MAVVTTGFFDGVHLGHRRVIETLVRTAGRRGDESLVLTFWPHPRIMLQSDAAQLRLLSTAEEKIAMLKDLGVDRVEVIPFTREFAAMTAAEYLKDVVMGRYGASALVLGYDNRIGSDLKLPADVQGMVSNLGLEMEVVPAFGDISSTRIRAALSLGNIDEATRMLGYGYALEGMVVSGKRLGRTIGFPTANMQMKHPIKTVPGRGAYITEVEVMGRIYVGMTNVADVVETHILDFSDDIYGMDIKLTFRQFLREMKAFSSLDELKEQLRSDKENILLSLHKYTGFRQRRDSF